MPLLKLILTRIAWKLEQNSLIYVKIKSFQGQKWSFVVSDFTACSEQFTRLCHYTTLSQYSDFPSSCALHAMLPVLTAKFKSKLICQGSYLRGK